MKNTFSLCIVGGGFVLVFQGMHPSILSFETINKLKLFFERGIPKPSFVFVPDRVFQNVTYTSSMHFVFELCRRTQQPSLTSRLVGGSTFGL
jgi:hypothetical protein